jgi:hypothetical protein
MAPQPYVTQSYRLVNAKQAQHAIARTRIHPIVSQCRPVPAAQAWILYRAGKFLRDTNDPIQPVDPSVRCHSHEL